MCVAELSSINSTIYMEISWFHWMKNSIEFVWSNTKCVLLNYHWSIFTFVVFIQIYKALERYGYSVICGSKSQQRMTMHANAWVLDNFQLPLSLYGFFLTHLQNWSSVKNQFPMCSMIMSRFNCDLRVLH